MLTSCRGHDNYFDTFKNQPIEIWMYDNFHWKQDVEVVMLQRRVALDDDRHLLLISFKLNDKLYRNGWNLIEISYIIHVS